VWGQSPFGYGKGERAIIFLITSTRNEATRSFSCEKEGVNETSEQKGYSERGVRYKKKRRGKRGALVLVFQPARKKKPNNLEKGKKGVFASGNCIAF